MNFYTFNSTLRPASAETIYLQLQSRAKLVLAYSVHIIVRLPKPVSHENYSFYNHPIIPRELSLTLLILNHSFYKWTCR